MPLANLEQMMTSNRQQGSSYDKNSFKDRRIWYRSREKDTNYRNSRPLPRPRV